jgi:hypothetical protein
MDCIKAIYEVWRETREVHHGADGKIKDGEKLRPLAVKAHDELAKDWREQLFMVHEDYIANRPNEQVLVSRLLISLKIFIF